MDRRQRKTREAIFKAFIELLSKKDFTQITVGEIIVRADVGRATFYAHFETKDFLLKALCEELFCHIFDAENSEQSNHQHLFDCNPPDSAFLHLFQHLQKNDNNILELLSSQNNELFLSYFKCNLLRLIISHKLFARIPNPRLRSHASRVRPQNIIHYKTAKIKKNRRKKDLLLPFCQVRQVPFTGVCQYGHQRLSCILRTSRHLHGSPTGSAGRNAD